MADTTTINITTESNQPDVPQLSPKEQAGAIMIVLGAMIISLFIIIALWPVIPNTDRTGLYSCTLFHVRPICLSDTTIKRCCVATSTPALSDSIAIVGKELVKLRGLVQNSEQLANNAALQKDLEENKKKLAETRAKYKKLTATESDNKKNHVKKVVKPEDDQYSMQLDNLLLILVATGGFLGNLIHVSKSLTYYIGMKKFQRSWIPWYFIKPFTASGLAILIYLATNSGTNGTINLFTIMLTAGLAGLFSDIATQKLKQIFEAILKPADTHPPVTTTAVKPPVSKASVDLSRVEPEKINPGAVNKIKIPGQNLDVKNLVIQINGKTIDNPVITATEITFDYQPGLNEENLTEFYLHVTDVSSNLDAKKTWTIQ